MEDNYPTEDLVEIKIRVIDYDKGKVIHSTELIDVEDVDEIELLLSGAESR